MFWYDKDDPRTTFMDKRCYHERLTTGHVIDVDPDIQADFTAMPFEDESFDLVVFDPPIWFTQVNRRGSAKSTEFSTLKRGQR